MTEGRLGRKLRTLAPAEGGGGWSAFQGVGFTFKEANFMDVLVVLIGLSALALLIYYIYILMKDEA